MTIGHLAALTDGIFASCWLSATTDCAKTAAPWTKGRWRGNARNSSPTLHAFYSRTRDQHTMTAATLRSLTAKDLAQMARERGVSGWHSMRKEELVGVLIRIARRKATADAKTGGRNRVPVNGSPLRSDRRARARRVEDSPQVKRMISQLHSKLATVKNLAAVIPEGQARQDRLVVMVRDPYWLHAYWELSPRSVDRAQAAMGQRWHGAQPVLRLSHAA